MIDSLHDNKQASDLINQQGPCEQAVRWIEEQAEVLSKAMRDKIACGGTLIVDLKTSADPTPQGFAKSVVNFGYHRQAAWYLDGHAAATGNDAVGMVFIVVGKEPPHDVACYELDYEAITLVVNRIKRTFGVWITAAKLVIGLASPTTDYDDFTARLTHNKPTNGACKWLPLNWPANRSKAS